MPGGLTLLASPNSGIPTPAAGKVTIFFSLDLIAPAYKNDTGVVLPLTGAAGVQGIQGLQGPEGEMPDYPLALPGPQGNPGTTGATGAQGPPGITWMPDDPIPEENIIPSVPITRSPGAWELIATQALSGAAQYDFNNLSQYTDLRIFFLNVTFGSSSQTQVRVSIDNGATFLAASGDYVGVAGIGSTTNFTELIPYSGAATVARSGEVFIQGTNLVNCPKISRTVIFSSDSVYERYMPTNGAINGIRINNSAAVNFTGGTAYIMGRR